MAKQKKPARHIAAHIAVAHAARTISTSIPGTGKARRIVGRVLRVARAIGMLHDAFRGKGRQVGADPKRRAEIKAHNARAVAQARANIAESQERLRKIHEGTPAPPGPSAEDAEAQKLAAADAYANRVGAAEDARRANRGKAFEQNPYSGNRQVPEPAPQSDRSLPVGIPWKPPAQQEPARQIPEATPSQVERKDAGQERETAKEEKEQAAPRQIPESAPTQPAEQAEASTPSQPGRQAPSETPEPEAPRRKPPRQIPEQTPQASPEAPAPTPRAPQTMLMPSAERDTRERPRRQRELPQTTPGGPSPRQLPEAAPEQQEARERRKEAYKEWFKDSPANRARGSDGRFNGEMAPEDMEGGGERKVPGGLGGAPSLPAGENGGDGQKSFDELKEAVRELTVEVKTLAKAIQEQREGGDGVAGPSGDGSSPAEIGGAVKSVLGSDAGNTVTKVVAGVELLSEIAGAFA